MYIDDFLVLSDAQAITLTTDSTNYIDTLAAGWAENDEVYAKFQVDTLFAGTAGTTIQLAIQIAQDVAFATLITVATYNLALASATAGAVPFIVKLPSNLVTTGYRYIRAYYTVTTSGSLTAGKIDCRLVKDVDVLLNKVL